METNIGISKDHLKSVVEILSGILANEVTLYMKTRKFHWNVTGESFMEFHKLFEKQYELLDEAMDQVAERIGKLGSPAIGTLEECLKLTTIKEHPGQYPSSIDMVSELLKDHEMVIVELRKDVDACADKYKDAGTVDFLTALMETHETIAWTVRRYLNKF